MSTTDDFNSNADSHPGESAEDWFLLEPGAFPAVSRPDTEQVLIRNLIKLPVRDSEGYQKRADKVDAALLILSQSPTARRLAEAAIKEGYMIHVDPPVISGLGNDEETVTHGSTNHSTKRINLKGIDDPLQMAIVLGHELTHVSQFAKGGFSPSVTPYHPLTAIKQSLVMEGDARAHEFLIALELSYAQKNDPAGRLIFPEMMDIAAENIGGPLTKNVIAHFKPQFPDGIDKEEMMLRVFKSFFGDPGLRQVYERAVLHSMETLEEEHPGAWKDNRVFKTELTGPDFSRMVDSHDIPYLAGHDKYIGLDTPLMSALSDETLQRLGDIEKIRRQNPDTATERPWTDAPSFRDIAVNSKPSPPKAATP